MNSTFIRIGDVGGVRTKYYIATKWFAIYVKHIHLIAKMFRVQLGAEGL